MFRINAAMILPASFLIRLALFLKFKPQSVRPLTPKKWVQCKMISTILGRSIQQWTLIIAWLQIVGNSAALLASGAGYIIGLHLMKSDTEGAEYPEFPVVNEYQRLTSVLILSAIVFGLGVAMGILLFLGTQQRSLNKLVIWGYYMGVHIVCSLLVLKVLTGRGAAICFGCPIFINVAFIAIVYYHAKEIIATHYAYLNP